MSITSSVAAVTLSGRDALFTNHVFTLQTVEVSILRILFTGLKDFLVDTNMIFTPEGIFIVDMDKAHTILVSLELHRNKFDYYQCKRDKIVIGVNVQNLHKIINAMDNNDTLTMYIDNSDFRDGVVSNLTFRTESSTQTQQKVTKFRTFEPAQEELEFPVIHYSARLPQTSADFQKIISNAAGTTNAEKITIQYVNGLTIYKYKSNFAEVTLTRGTQVESSSEMTVFHGEYPLKYLVCITKFTNLCQSMSLHLEQDMPLTASYNVGTLGEIRFSVADTLPL